MKNLTSLKKSFLILTLTFLSGTAMADLELKGHSAQFLSNGQDILEVAQSAMGSHGSQKKAVTKSLDEWRSLDLKKSHAKYQKMRTWNYLKSFSDPKAELVYKNFGRFGNVARSAGK